MNELKALTPVNFYEANTQLAKDQDEYQTLPCFVDENDPNTPFISCWALSDDDLININVKKQIWLIQYTFRRPFQPVGLFTTKPLNPDTLKVIPVEKESIDNFHQAKVFIGVKKLVSISRQAQDLIYSFVPEFYTPEHFQIYSAADSARERLAWFRIWEAIQTLPNTVPHEDKVLYNFDYGQLHNFLMLVDSIIGTYQLGNCNQLFTEPEHLDALDELKRFSEHWLSKI